MNITAKIIITDTNIITDLNNANILEEFINIDNVYISDMIKNDEINSKTGNVKLMSKLKGIKDETETNEANSKENHAGKSDNEEKTEMNKVNNEENHAEESGDDTK